MDLIYLQTRTAAPWEMERENNRVNFGEAGYVASIHQSLLCGCVEMGF